jgi:hypothetical protein
MELDLEQKRKMLDDGYIVIPGVVPRPMIDEALREINHRLGLGRTQTMDAYADSRDYWSDDTDAPAIMDLLLRSPLWDIAESAVGAGERAVDVRRVAVEVEAGDDFGPRVRRAVAVRVLQSPDAGGRGHVQRAVVPARAHGERKPVGEDAGGVEPAVAVGVLQHEDAMGPLAEQAFGVEIDAGGFADVEPPAFVKTRHHGVTDERRPGRGLR